MRTELLLDRARLNGQHGVGTRRQSRQETSLPQFGPRALLSFAYCLGRGADRRRSVTGRLVG
eukprot:8964070-Pyramimonas_sp.AAC.1